MTKHEWKLTRVHHMMSYCCKLCGEFIFSFNVKNSYPTKAEMTANGVSFDCYESQVKRVLES